MRKISLPIMLFAGAGLTGAYLFLSKKADAAEAAAQDAPAEPTPDEKTANWVASFSKYVVPDPGTSWTIVNGISVPMAGRVTLFGNSIPYNLNPTFSPVYKSYLAGPVNQSAQDQILQARETKQAAMLAGLVGLTGLAVAFKLGEGASKKGG